MNTVIISSKCRLEESFRSEKFSNHLLKAHLDRNFLYYQFAVASLARF